MKGRKVPTRTRKTKKILQRANTNLQQLQMPEQPLPQQPKRVMQFEHLDSDQQIDDQLFQSKQAQEMNEQKLTIVPTVRSFSSAPMQKNEATGDYSKEAEMMMQPDRRIMDKIA